MEKVNIFVVGGIEDDRLILYWSNIPLTEKESFYSYWRAFCAVVLRSDDERTQPWTYESTLDIRIGEGKASRWITIDGPMVDFRKVPNSGVAVNLFEFFHDAIIPAAFRECVNKAEEALGELGFLQRFWWFNKKLLWVHRACNSAEDFKFLTCMVEQSALESEKQYLEWLDKLKRLRLIGNNKKELRRPRIQDDVAALVLARDGEMCVRCGATNALEFDHILPLSRGGSSSEDNLQILCRRCNAKRGALK